MLNTGQFSRLPRVSKRTLRYYDSIDLFKPIHVDTETGTRYYNAKQFVDLNRILALKELGLSLSQIQRMLDKDVSEEEIRGMLLLKKAETEQALLDQLQRFRSIEARLQNPQTFLTEGVVLKSVPEQTFLSCRTIIDPHRAMEFTMQILEEVPLRLGRSNVGCYTTLMHWDAFDLENMDAEVGFVLPKPLGVELRISDEITLRERPLPAIKTAASAVLVGGPAVYPVGFNAVGQWAEDHGFTVGEPQREIFLEFDPSQGEEGMVIELQFPVTRRLVGPEGLLNPSL